MFLTIMFCGVVLAYFVFALFCLRRAVMFLPLFFPLYLWKAEFIGVPFTLVECLIYVCLMAFVVIELYSNVIKSRKKVLVDKLTVLLDKHVKQVFPWKYMIPILLIVVCALISVFIAPDKTYMIDGVNLFYGRRLALGIFKGWIIAPMIMFILYLHVLKNGKDILKILDIYTVSAVILSFFALYQAITGKYLTPDQRVSGPFESANYLALYIAPSVVYSFLRLKESLSCMGNTIVNSFFCLFRFDKDNLIEGKCVTFLYFIGFAVLSVALLFTKSYAAMLAVSLSSLFYLGIEYRRCIKEKYRHGDFWRRIFIVAAIIAVAILFVYLLDPVKWQKMFDFNSRNSSSVRVEVYTVAFSLWVKNWFWGIGLGQFPVSYQLGAMGVIGHVPYELNMLHPHNLYLAVWLNLGVVGFVSFLWILYYCLRECFVWIKCFSTQKCHEEGKVRMIGFALLMVILIHGLFDTPYFKADLSLLFWMVAVIILVPDHETKIKPKK